MKKIIDYISTWVAKLAEKAKGAKTAENIEIYESNEMESENITNINKITEDNKKYWMTDFLKFWAMGLVIAYLWFLAYGVMDTIYLIILGYILSVAIESYIWRLLSKWISKSFAILISYICLIGIIFGGILVVVPFIATQISDIVQIIVNYVEVIQWYISKMWVLWYMDSLDMPIYIKSYIKTLTTDPKYMQSLQDTLLGSIDTIVKQWTSYAGNAWSLLLWTIKDFASVIFQITLVFTAAILFSVDQENIIKYINKISHSEEFSLKIKKIYTKIWYWLKSQLLLCIFIFVTVYATLLILELFGISIPNKLSLAIISWITEIIPYIWPFIWAVPGILVWSISDGRVGFLVMSCVYISIQQLENNVFIPMLMNKTLGVSPVLMFVCMVLLGMVMWVTWIVMAIPISIIISVMAE